MTLTHETAAQYVRDFIAKGGDKAFIDRIEPCADMAAINVFFGVNNLHGDKCFTVCVEQNRDGSSFLYGEW